MGKNQQFHATKIRPLVQIIAGVIRKNPEMLENPDYLMAQLGQHIAGFNNPSECLNCGASMAEYAESIDVNDALLLLSMAKIIKNNQAIVPNFTDANRVRVSSENIHHTQKCRTAKCRKLGLIAKAGESHWAITDRGWAAIRGEAIPRTRISFRNQIIDRPNELVTFAQIFGDHRNKMIEKERQGKPMKNDKRIQFADYDPSEWVHVSGFHQGALI